MLKVWLVYKNNMESVDQDKGWLELCAWINGNDYQNKVKLIFVKHQIGTATKQVFSIFNFYTQHMERKPVIPLPDKNFVS